MRGDTQPVSRRAFWALADQGAVSAGNFLTGWYLARTLPPSEFGIYVVIIGVMIFANTIHAALVTSPLCVKGAAAGAPLSKRYTGWSLALTTGFLPVQAIAIAAICFGLGRLALAPWAVMALLLWQLQETVRSGLVSQCRFRSAIVGDFVSYIGQALAVVALTRHSANPLSPWSWQSPDGKRCIEVYPSIKGRATQFDKDVLIYVISQMTEALNRKREDARKRTVRFVVYDYLVSTNRLTGGQEYQRLRLALERLAGTRITTDIRTGGKSGSSGFGIIDQWKIARKAPDDKRMIAVEVTLSEWLFNAVQAHEVLTINRDYFRLRKPLERRLYELARKHCGHQRSWPIGLELLREKCGANSNTREFRRQLVAIIKAHVMPEYLISYDRDKDQVTFFNKKLGRP